MANGQIRSDLIITDATDEGSTEARALEPSEADRSLRRTADVALPATAPAPRLTGRSGWRLRMADAWRAAVDAERERGVPFLFLPVAMGGGAALYSALPREPVLNLLLVLLAVAIAGAAILAATSDRRLPVALLAAAAVAGMVAGSLESRRGPVLLDSDVTTTISGTVVAREIDAGGRARYLIDVAGTAEPIIRRPPSRVRVVARAAHQPLPVGGTITGRARLSPPSGPAYPRGYDFARSAFSQGIGAYGFFYTPPQAASAAAIVRPEGGLSRLADELSIRISALRARIAERVRTVVAGDAGALIAALTVSDRRGISEQTVDDLRATGLAHILAISGLHMALAAGTFFFVLRKIGALFPALVERHPVKKYAAAGAIVIATAYLMISGAAISTQRAWLMMTVMFGSVLSDRPALTMRNVALAAILIILTTPSAVVSPGFQMSFAATAALIAAYDGWSRRKRKPEQESGLGLLASDGWAARIGRGIGGLAMTSIVAGLATGLFAAYHFHRIAGFGVIANLLAMPLVTFVVMPAGLLGMLAMPFGLDAWPLWLMGWGLEGVVAIAGMVAGLGGDRLTGALPFWATAAVGAGFIWLVLLKGPLRFAGVVPIAAGLLVMPVLRAPPPDLLISEDGRLIGIFTDTAIASNAARPSEFIFEQWQTAFLRPEHIAPEKFTPLYIAPEPHALLADLFAAAVEVPGRFVCLDRQTCAAVFGGYRLAALGDPAHLGAGCDLADIVVLSVPIRTDRCYSGARLITARTLLRTGALALRLEEDDTSAPKVTATADYEAGAAGGVENTKGGGLIIEAALSATVRPWTIQRYFDWRSDSFDLPDTAAARARMVAADRERVWHVGGQAPVRATDRPATPATPANQQAQIGPEKGSTVQLGALPLPAATEDSSVKPGPVPVSDSGG